MSFLFFFFKQKTAYEMRISDWSSDVCSSDLGPPMRPNKIKQMWRDGKYVTLGWLSVSHGFTAEIMARQGFDALCVDLQHGTSEMNDVLPMLQAISQTDTAPVVRVAWNDPEIGRAHV